MSPDGRRSAAVVGAGIGGLTAAHRLTQAGWDVTVYEAEARPGGRVETIARDGYLVDTGATAIAARYPIFTELALELGMEITWTAPYLGVVRDGRVRLLRLDRLVRSGVRTDLLSPITKLRLAKVVFDIARAKSRGMLDYDDLRNAGPLDTETARDYMRRIAGQEADTFLGEPITRALLLANSDQVSRVELMSGLINAVAGRLSTLGGGQATIIDALAARIPPIRLNTPVTEVVQDATDVAVTSGAGERARFDACVIACPPPAALAISPGHNAALTALTDRLHYTRAINVAVGTTRPADTPACLVQLPRGEDAEVCMLIFENNKAPDRAPAGHGLISVSWEMTAAAAWFDRPDEALVERSLETVFRLFPALRGTVDFTYVRRWSPALPHTRPGVYQRIGEFVAGLDQTARIQFAGDFLSQTGQNTAVAWGNRAAENLNRHVRPAILADSPTGGRERVF
jgi:protoporphyrinogen/coproporphyrinogen III oxidase